MFFGMYMYWIGKKICKIRVTLSGTPRNEKYVIDLFNHHNVLVYNLHKVISD